MYTLRVGAATVLVALALPFITHAATLQELQAQIARLMAQLSSLQQENASSQQAAQPQCPNLTRSLSRGARGTDVTALQDFLISKNHLAPDSATGFFGTLTEAAVKKFQAKERIVSSGTPASTGYGMVGAKTRAAIAALCRKAAISPSYSQGSYMSPGYNQGSYGTTPSYSQGQYYSQSSYTSCAPLPQETRTQSCPAGQSGAITQVRTSVCATGATSPAWGEWETRGSTCKAGEIGRISERSTGVFNEVVIKGVAAGAFDPNKLKNWNSYYFPYVIQAQYQGLANVYAANIFKHTDGTWRLFYGGWDTQDTEDHTDRIYSAKSISFLGRGALDFSPPEWMNRRTVITNNGHYVANDPSIVQYGPSQYLMLYSTADGVPGHDTIASAVSTDLDNWYTSSPSPDRYIEVNKQESPVSFMGRPSVLLENGIFYLYYDQGGQPGAISNNGFNIQVATGLNGIHFSDRGMVFPHGSPENGYSATPDVAKFDNHWIMFYDRALNALQYALSSDGIRFEDKGLLVADWPATITNIGVIREGNRLLGVLYGEAPKTEASLCSSPYYHIGGYCMKMNIKALFLQKKVEFTTESGEVWSDAAAIDEDRLVLRVPAGRPLPASGTLRIYDTDNTTLIAEKRVNLTKGILYEVGL